MSFSVVFLKRGELAVRIKLRRHPVKCSECGRQVGLGEWCWIDYIPLKYPKNRFYRKFICEVCWRGPKNIWREHK